MLCICLTIMYMELKICFTNGYTWFSPTMYMFVQNSKKKFALEIQTLKKRSIFKHKKAENICSLPFI
jgi:hypothetical protein